MTCLPVRATPLNICHQFPLEIDDLLAHQGNTCVHEYIFLYPVHILSWGNSLAMGVCAAKQRCSDAKNAVAQERGDAKNAVVQERSGVKMR